MMKSKQPKTVPIAAEASPPSGGGVSRRTFFRFFWGALGLAAMVELVWIVLSFLRPSEQQTGDSKRNTVIPAGAVESFAAGTVTAFQSGQFYLVRMDSGGFLALSCKCTHLGCIVPWVEKEKKFLCPCHASAFDVTGTVLSAPAPRPLDAYLVTIENNILKVDTSRRIKRSRFEPGQLVHPGKN